MLCVGCDGTMSLYESIIEDAALEWFGVRCHVVGRKASSAQSARSSAHLELSSTHLPRTASHITEQRGTEGELRRQAAIRNFRIARQELDFHLDTSRYMMPATAQPIESIRFSHLDANRQRS